MSTKRWLLVVEDKPEVNNDYAQACKLAVKELSDNGLEINAAVKQVFNFYEARDYLKEFQAKGSAGGAAQKENLSVISIDMALHPNEEHTTDERREAGQEVSGMRILQSIENVNPQPLAIVVTGEDLSSISIDAFQTYHVFGFFQKSRMRMVQYRSAIKAALLYNEAIDIIEKAKKMQKDSDINLAKLYWEKAVQAAREAKISEKNFPVNVATKIKAEFVDKNTELPEKIWARQILLSKVVGEDRMDWSFLQVSITTKDVSYFHYISKDDIASFFFELANFIRDAINQVSLQEYSLIILDSEYLSKPSILLVTTGADSDLLQQIASIIKEAYKKVASTFTSLGKVREIVNEQKLNEADVKERIKLTPMIRLVDSSGLIQDISSENTRNGSKNRYIDVPFYVWDSLIDELEM